MDNVPAPAPDDALLIPTDVDLSGFDDATTSELAQALLMEDDLSALSLAHAALDEAIPFMNDSIFQLISLNPDSPASLSDFSAVHHGHQPNSSQRASHRPGQGRPYNAGQPHYSSNSSSSSSPTPVRRILPINIAQALTQPLNITIDQDKVARLPKCDADSLSNSIDTDPLGAPQRASKTSRSLGIRRNISGVWPLLSSTQIFA
jgi:hypothetical protein